MRERRLGVTRLAFLLGWVLIGSGTLAVSPEDGRAGSSSRTRDLVAEPSYSRVYGLVIGVGAYRNLPRSEWIPEARQSAAVVADLLSSRYSFDRVSVYLDEAASRESIEEVLRGFLTGISPDDALFVYWAGHATSKTSRGREVFGLVPYDGDEQGGEFEWRNLSTDSMLEEIARDVPASNIFVLMDTCYGSSALRERVEAVLPSKAFFRGVAKKIDRRGLTVWKPCSDRSLLYSGTEPTFGERVVSALTDEQEVFSVAGFADAIRAATPEGQGEVGGSEAFRWSDFDGKGEFTFVPDPARAPDPESLLGNIQLNVNVSGARVMMDGDELESAEGRRIVNLRKVEAGTHQIRVEKEGYRFFSQSIEVPTDEWVQVQAVLYKEVIAAPVPPTPAEASDEGNQVLSAEIVNGVQKASGASLEGKEQSLEEESPVDGASLGSGKAGAAMAAPLKGGPDPRDGGTRVQAKPGPTSSGLNSSIEYCAECPVAPVEELVKSPGGEPVGVFVAPVGETAGLSKDVGYSERASAGVSAAASEIEDDARLAGEGGEVLAKDRVRARPGSSKALGWRRYSSTSGGGVSNSGAGVPSKADKVEARTGGSVEAEDGEDAAVDPIPYEPRFLNSKAQASSGSGTPGQARAAGEASSRFEGAKPEPVVAAPIPPPP